MTIAARPDVVAAVIARLRTFTEITSLTSTRISARLQPTWTGMPTYAILVRPAFGPPGKRQINNMRSRLDVSCYGATEALAAALWRQLDACFCPGQENLNHFTQTVGSTGVRVYGVDPESMPASGIEPGTEWPRTLCTYVVSWCGVAA